MSKWKGPPHEEIPRCHAKTRTGGLCGHYTMQNGRCRYHGGKSTGAVKPHRPIQHGYYTKEAIMERRNMNLLVRDARDTIKEILG